MGRTPATTLEDKLIVLQSAHQRSNKKQLEQALKDEGFINIQISPHANTSFLVVLKNRRYKHNEVDAIGVALGIISSHAGTRLFNELALHTNKQAVELIMLSNGLAITSVDTDMNCYRKHITAAKTCNNITIDHQTARAVYGDADWDSKKINSGFGRTQLSFSPLLRQSVATEYGVYDYSLALGSNLYTTLWAGAAIDVRYVMPVSNREGFDDERIFAHKRYQSEIDTTLIHQAFTLPFNIINQTSAGYIKSGFVGVTNETQWYFLQDYHSVCAEVNYFHATDEYDDYANLHIDEVRGIAFYRLSIPELNWQAKVEWSEFWRGNVGFLINKHALVRRCTYRCKLPEYYFRSLPE